MNTKTLLAALAAGIASFLLGWVVYGIALKGFMDERTAKHALEIMKTEPNIVGLLAGNLVYGVLIAWALSRMGATTLMSGFMVGLILAGLIGLCYDLFFFSMMNMYKGRMVIAVDVLVNAVLGGAVGAVAGYVLGMGAKAKA